MKRIKHLGNLDHYDKWVREIIARRVSDESYVKIGIEMEESLPLIRKVCKELRIDYKNLACG
jgi:hypothetical protein